MNKKPKAKNTLVKTSKVATQVAKPAKSGGKGKSRVSSRLCNHDSLQKVFAAKGRPHLYAVARVNELDAEELLESNYKRVFIVGPTRIVLDIPRVDAKEVERSKEVIASNELVAGLAKYVGGSGHTGYPKNAFPLPIPWPDFSSPHVEPGFWYDLADIVRPIDAVIASCMGAHGRTGTTLALLAYIFGYIKESEVKTAMDLVEKVREVYCESAIESETQLQYIADVTGLPEGKWRPRKSPYAGGGHYGSSGVYYDHYSHRESWFVDKKERGVGGVVSGYTSYDNKDTVVKEDLLNDPFYYSDRLPLDYGDDK